MASITSSSTSLIPRKRDMAAMQGSSNIMAAKLPVMPADIALPPLPEIEDETIRRTVFTHSSAAPRGNKSLFDMSGVQDNEKLEHVGDSLVNTNITLMLHQLFPHIQPGGATLLKSHLASNELLAQVSARYQLISRLKAEPSQVPMLRKNERAQANLFEAYIAGLYLSYLESSDLGATGRAFSQVAQYLQPLFHPIAMWAYAELKAELKRIETSQVAEDENDNIDTLAQGATAMLNQHFIKYFNACPTYDAQRLGEASWTIVCTAQGGGKTFTATATRANKKAASQVAAYKVCDAAGLLKEG